MYNYNTLINEFLQYKNFLGYKYRSDAIILNQIKNYLEENNIETITKDVTINFAKLNLNITQNCLARNMGTFREFCKYLKYQRGIECYQIPSINYKTNPNSYIPYVFSHFEIKTIYSHLNFINQNYHYTYYAQITYPLIIKILYQTGMRIGEVLKLQVKNFQYDLGIFIIKNAKNNEERIVAISEKLNEKINEFILKFKLKNNDLLFKMNVTTIENYFKKILLLSNITQKARLHDLRHTYIVHNIELAIKNNKNMDNFLPILAAQVGHKSLNSLSYYFHVTNDILNEVTKISNEKLGYLIKIEESYE